MTIEHPMNDLQAADLDDITLGAYLVTHLRTLCENCGATETPQWRKGWFSEVIQRNTSLCNKCGIKYNKNQFCSYCKFIYGKEHDKRSKEWVTCNMCGRSNHAECEEKFGDKTYTPENGGYRCPNCRHSRTFY